NLKHNLRLMLEIESYQIFAAVHNMMKCSTKNV
ncbi:hypothetical protein HMPREF1532_00001, partial [Bacteroides salyersiae WAL 10018 = DSM 18765 = JCM 12988]